MSYRATGTFEVTIEPLSAVDDPFGRMRIVKEFTGDLVADGLGEMLTVATELEGSATYVALDRITGTLNGRRGTFVLRHNGIMTRGVGELSVDVVPDSGTAELTGLTGQLAITNDNGRHSYVFDYDLT
jgi:hypothetical protein